jgi:hypothetical protein
MCLLPRASTGVTSGGAKRYHELKTKAKVSKKAVNQRSY